LKITGFFLFSLLTCVAGCSPSGFAHDEPLVGPYRLVAVDADAEMGICWSVPKSDGDCVGDGLPTDTVYAAGYDERYLVAAVHPTARGKPINKSETNYYYVIRTSEEQSRFPLGQIRGPLNQTQYEAAKAKLNLPEFSRVFDMLR
jgi:hypothetical protein